MRIYPFFKLWLIASNVREIIREISGKIMEKLGNFVQIFINIFIHSIQGFKGFRWLRVLMGEGSRQGETRPRTKELKNCVRVLCRELLSLF